MDVEVRSTIALAQGKTMEATMVFLEGKIVGVVEGPVNKSQGSHYVDVESLDIQDGLSLPRNFWFSTVVHERDEGKSSRGDPIRRKVGGRHALLDRKFETCNRD